MWAVDEAWEGGEVMGKKAPNRASGLDRGALCRLRGSFAPLSVVVGQCGALFRLAVPGGAGPWSRSPAPVDPAALRCVFSGARPGLSLWR